jgi:hypothetical protein
MSNSNSQGVSPAKAASLKDIQNNGFAGADSSSIQNVV